MFNVEGTSHAAVLRQHGFHALPVARVVDETHDTRTFVFDVPPDLADTFTYRPGQFCTVRAHIGGEEVLRCYSMSSAPATDTEMAVTVKRVPGGRMSNWLHDHVRAGDTLELMRPSGIFCTQPDTADDVPVVAFCGGSGVTPVFSIVKDVLATTRRPVHVLYANRDADSVIFRADLDRLAGLHPDRLTLRHHLDDAAGFLTPTDISCFVGPHRGANFFVCGPTPFMDVVEAGLTDAGIAPAQIAIERFALQTGSDPVGNEDDAASPPLQTGSDPVRNGELTIILRGARLTFPYTPGDTVLDAGRRAGLKPPFSCELGNCASCMATVHEGHVTMRQNNALTPDEVAAGFVLTCQGKPDALPCVVEYEDL